MIDTLPRLCFGIPASPNDKFYSQIAMFRRALDALGGIYEQADVIVALGDEHRSPLPPRWQPHLARSVTFHWADTERYRRSSYSATGDACLAYDYGAYDVVIFCDADTLLVKPIDDLWVPLQTSPALMGVIAHYPFPRNPAESNIAAWTRLAGQFARAPIAFDFRYTLASPLDPPESASCPYYVNAGFVVVPVPMLRTLRDTFLTIRPGIASSISVPYFAGQIALALSILATGLPREALGMRYNFPNDPVAERRYPKELEDIRLIHYLRADKFDRHAIFVSEREFKKFLRLRLDGSNAIFQDCVHKLTNGRYPF